METIHLHIKEGATDQMTSNNYIKWLNNQCRYRQMITTFYLKQANDHDIGNRLEKNICTNTMEY